MAKKDGGKKKKDADLAESVGSTFDPAADAPPAVNGHALEEPLGGADLTAGTTPPGAAAPGTAAPGTAAPEPPPLPAVGVEPQALPPVPVEPVDPVEPPLAAVTRERTSSPAPTPQRAPAPAPKPAPAPASTPAPTPTAPASSSRSGTDLADAALVPLQVARSVLPTSRTSVVLGVVALGLVGVVDWPAAVGIGLGWEALRRWAPERPRR